jgi:hypothetical protein
MKAPLCRVCGVAHWGREPHRFTERVERLVHDAVNDRVDREVANTPPLATKAVNAVANTESRHGVYADKAKRLAYMREYMKKRRSESGER